MEDIKQLQNCLKEWKNNAITMTTYKIYDHYEPIKLQLLPEKKAILNHFEMELGFYCIPFVFWNVDYIQFFVQNGFDLNGTDTNGDTALHLAIRYSGSHGEQVIRYLLGESSVDPNISNLRGENAMFDLVRNSNQVWSENKSLRLKVAKLLLDRGSNCAARNKHGQTVFHVINSDHPAFLKFLLKKYEGNVDIRCNNQFYARTPLMVAAQEGNIRLCRLLVKRGADVNARDLQGYTPLHHSLTAGVHEKCAKFLVDSGSDPNAKSTLGRDAYDVAFLIGLYRGYQLYASEFNCFTYRAKLQRRREIKLMAKTLKNEQMIGIGDRLWPEVERTNLKVFLLLRLFEYSALPRELPVDNLMFSIKFLLKRGEIASLEETDFNSFSYYFRYLLFMHRNRLSDLNPIVSLYVRCLEERIRVTGSRILPLYEPYYTVCILMKHWLSKFRNNFTRADLIDNERLFKTLVEMDLRSEEGDSLLHNNDSLSFGVYFTYFEFAETLIDLGANLTCKNNLGLEPTQTIDWKKQGELNEEVLINMANGGAHLDARNAHDGFTLLEVLERKGCSTFQFDNLQCRCARVVARNLVAYKNRVPKKIAAFIDDH